MVVIQKKPRSPGSRRVVHTKYITFRKSIKKKFMYRSLRNGYCPKGLNSKKINKRLTKFYKPMRGTIWSGSAIEIFKVSYANYYMANIEFGYGGKYTIKAPEGLHILWKVPKVFFSLKESTSIFPGFSSVIGQVSTGSFVYSIRLINHIKFSMAESAGIGCKVYWHERDRGLTYLKIPSNKKVKFSSLYPSRLGRVSNVFFNKTVYGKAGNNRLKKKKFPSVRGIAMNAVDHPNGGRTNTKSPYRNPWGFPAKKGR